MNKNHLKRLLLLVLGILCIIVGFIGLVLPFLQGVLFLAVGVLLLSFYSPSIRTRLDKYTTPYPKIHRFILTLEDRIVRLFNLEK